MLIYIFRSKFLFLRNVQRLTNIQILYYLNTFRFKTKSTFELHEWNKRCFKKYIDLNKTLTLTLNGNSKQLIDWSFWTLTTYFNDVFTNTIHVIQIVGTTTHLPCCSVLYNLKMYVRAASMYWSHWSLPT